MSELLNDTKLRIEAFIAENAPDVDVAPGTVLNELLIKLNAVLQNPIVNDMLELDQGNTISEVLTSTTDTYNTLVDGIASNYNTSRNKGTKSTGKIKVTVASATSYFIRTGFVFYQPVLNLNYVVTNDYTVKTNTTNTNDIPLVKENGVYYFIIPVEAEDVGAEYQVPNNSKFSLGTSSVLTGFVDGSAYGDFTTGLPADTDKVLVSKYQQSISNKSLLTKNSILFRLQELFPNVSVISLVGAADEEMTRNKHNAFGISSLGMTDVYVRSSIGPASIQITKTATQTNGVWSVDFDYNDVPGFYRVVSVLPTGQNLSGSITNTATFSFSTSGLYPANSVTTDQEGRFTKYQTCNITFVYTSPATEADFDIVLSYQPDITEIQDLCLSNDERIACADYLVKAVVPCYVTVHLKLHRRDTSIDLDTASIKKDIYNYINTIPFGEKLYISELIDICHNYNVKYVEMPIVIAGSVYSPEGTILQITGTKYLEIPDRVDLGVTANTTLFFTDYFNSASSNVNQSSMTESIGIEVL